ncbi:MAG: hypothetical protein NTX05_06900 [Fusobacteria bacterium]|nr:hypothetical protein [Fusobacteriota bacterium]
MLKKIVIAVIVVVIAVFIVLVYVKKEEKIPDSTYKVSMNKVKYVIDSNYTVVADSQTTQSGKIELNHVKASINNGFLQGNNGVLDSSDNLSLTGSVYGENTQGWSVTTSAIEYTKNTGMILANGETVFENKTTGTKITGDTFKAIQDYSQVTLKGNVVLDFKNYTITCDSASYSNSDSTVTLSGNIRIDGQNITTDKGDIAALIGGANGVKINTITQDMDLFGGYAVVADAITLKGNLLSYNLKNNTGRALGTSNLKYLDVNVSSKGYAFDMISQKATLDGPVSGSDSIGNFIATTMTIDAVNSLVSGSDEVIRSSNGLSVRAPSVICDEKSKITTFVGEDSSKVIAKNSRETLISDKMSVNSNSGDVLIPGVFTYSAQYKTLVTGVGSNLQYNQNSETGVASNVTTLYNGQESRADRVVFNFKNGTVEAIGNVILKQKNYVLAASDIKFNLASNKINVVSQFTVSDIKNSYTLTATHLNYNGNTNLATIQSLITIGYKGYLIYGTTLTYNAKSGNGTLGGNVYFTNSTQNITGKTDGQINISGNSLLQVIGNVEVNDNGSILNTKNATYDLVKKKGNMPNSGSIVNSSENYSVDFSSGVLDAVTQNVTLNGVTGSNQDMDYSAQFAKYNTLTKILVLSGNVMLTQENSSIKSDKLTYNTVSGDISYSTMSALNYNSMQMVSSSGQVNFETKTLSANFPIVTSTLGDKISASKATGDLNLMQFNFTGNVVGTVIPLTVQKNSKGFNATKSNLLVPINFSGSTAKVYFSQATLQRTKKYVVSRVELQGNGKVKYDTSELKANFMEFDNFSSYILAKGQASFKTSKEVGVETPQVDIMHIEATAQYIKSDITNLVTTLMYNVKILNKTKISGNANITTQEAKIDMKNNLIVMNGSATVYKNGNTISSNKATYNLITNTLIGSDHIAMKLVNLQK